MPYCSCAVRKENNKDVKTKQLNVYYCNIDLTYRGLASTLNKPGFIQARECKIQGLFKDFSKTF